MKKHCALFILVLTMILFLCSCSKNNDIFYYCYFEDEALALVYSNSKNKLYEVKLPLSQIRSWGKANGYEEIKDAIFAYCGTEASGYLCSSAEILQGYRDILYEFVSDEIDGMERPEAVRLEAFVEYASTLSNKNISDTISNLCGDNVDELLKKVVEKQPETFFLDSDSFDFESDLQYNRNYFVTWLKQVVWR